MSKQLYRVDENTGELIPVDGVELKPGDKVIRRKQIEYAKKRRSDGTRFVWILYGYGEKLFPNISPANLTRIIYAATYVNNDGSIMPIDQLREQLKLPQRTMERFMQEMLDNKALFIVDKMVYINETMFKVGEINIDVDHTRLFCNMIRAVYENCRSVSEHKYLSYIFRIIPFINRRTNILSYNQKEQDISKIHKMSVGKMCEILGYDKSHASRLVSELRSIKYNGVHVIGIFTLSNDCDKWAIIINPRLYYGGDRSSELFKTIDTLFSNHEVDSLNKFSDVGEMLLEGGMNLDIGCIYDEED